MLRLVRSMRGNALRHTSRPNAVSPRLTRPAATNAAFKQPPPTTEAPRASSSQFSGRTFESAPISAQSKKAITHKVMSDVQAATLDVGLAGKDLIVQAKTGTGKTLAFLLPTIERLIKSPRRHNGISVLVLSPTRELAFQIQKEAQTLLQYHEGMSVGCIIGGVNPNSTINTILKKKVNILIATPGRLHDHLTSPDIAAAVRAQFKNLETLIYDEADRLLDQGFKKELDGILAALPNRATTPRQVMLYSATFNQEVKRIAANALNKDHEFISTLTEDDVNTHEHVEQRAFITPFANALPTALRVLRQDRLTHAIPSPSQSSPKNVPRSTAKVVVFFPTARHVSVAHELFSNIPDLPPIFAIHSRASQSARTKASKGFYDAKEGILLSSDVAARGMDFPGVTLVVQIGLPSSAEQYVHRLGRTARAGASGHGIIILDPVEAPFLGSKDMESLRDRITPSYIPPASASTSSSSSVPDTFTITIKGREIQIPKADTPLEEIRTSNDEVSTALLGVKRSIKSLAYRAWLGYYRTSTKITKWSPEQMVAVGNAYVQDALGWPRDEKPPPLSRMLVGKMGLKNVKGLNVVANDAIANLDEE